MSSSLLRFEGITVGSTVHNKLAPVGCSIKRSSQKCLFASPLARAGRTTVPSKTFASKRTDEQVSIDFDKVFSDISDKFEASDNKAAIVGYSAAAIGALWFSEWLIHLPLLDFLLGFPIQLLGLSLLPYFGVKYYVEKEGNITSDAGKAFDRVVKQLPGFDK